MTALLQSKRMLWILYSPDPVPPVVVRVPCHTPDTLVSPLSGVCAMAIGVQDSIIAAASNVRQITTLRI